MISHALPIFTSSFQPDILILNYYIIILNIIEMWVVRLTPIHSIEIIKFLFVSFRNSSLFSSEFIKFIWYPIHGWFVFCKPWFYMFRISFSPFFSFFPFYCIIFQHFICFVPALFFHLFIISYSLASCSFWRLHNYLCTDYPFQLYATRIPLNAIYKLNKSRTNHTDCCTLYTLYHVANVWHFSVRQLSVFSRQSAKEKWKHHPLVCAFAA